MTEPAQQTQTGTPAGTAGASSDPASSTKPDPTSSQPADAATVDGGSAEDNRNAAASDGQNGGQSDDGGRNRPGRAERRINELTKELRAAEAKATEKDSLIEQLQKTPINPSDVPLPDYSKMAEITPDQLKTDIIGAADKIATLRTAQAFNEFGDKLTRRDAAGKALQEIAQAKRDNKVLDEGNPETYNADIDEKLGDTFKRIYDRDPSYSFLEHTETFLPGLIAEQNARDGTTTGAGARGRSANRSTASSRRSQKSVDDMSLEELEAHIHTQNR